MAETFEFDLSELPSSGSDYEPTTFEFDVEELGEKPSKGKKRWEQDVQMWSSHGEGARRAELVKKSGEEYRSGRAGTRKAITRAGAGGGGILGGVAAGGPTLGTMSVPGAILGAGMGYGLADMVNTGLFGEDPNKELAKMPPLVNAGPVGGTRGALRAVSNIPQSITNLAGMPYEMGRSVTDPMIRGDIGGMLEATKQAGVGLVDLPFTATGSKDIYEKVTGQQPFDTYMRNMQQLGEEDPAGLAFGAHIGAKVPGATWRGTKKAASAGLGLVTDPQMAKDLYRSAMKPTVKEGKSREVNQAIEQGLEKGAVINRRGTGLNETIRRVEAKEDVIQGILEPSTGRINVEKLDRGLDRIRRDAETDIENVDTIRSTADEYIKKIREHSKYDPVTDSIPVQEANVIKRKLYKNLRKGGAYDTGQVLAGRGTAAKGTARTLMEAIESVIPEIGPENKLLGQDLNLQKYLERATRRIENTDVMGVRTRLAMLMGVAAPKYAVISLLAAIMDNPSFKSRLAIAIHKANKGKMSLGEIKAVIDDIPNRAKEKFSADEPFNPEVTPAPEPASMGDYIPDRNVGKGLEEGGIGPRENMDISFNPETAGTNLNLGDAVPGRPGFMGQGLEEGGLPPKFTAPPPAGFNPEIGAPAGGGVDIIPGGSGRIVPQVEAMTPRPPAGFNPEVMAPAMSDLGARVATGREQSLETGVMPANEGLRAPGERLEPATPRPELQELVPGSKELNLEQGGIPGREINANYATQKLTEMGFTPEQIKVALDAMKKGGAAAMIAAILPFTQDDDNKALGLLGLMGAIAYHGTPAHTVEAIRKTGGLKPFDAEGVNKISAGLESESGLVWVTPKEPIAKQYAEAWEANSYREMRGKEPFKPGAIFKTDLPDDIKLIDNNHKLTQAEADILNPMLPHYKPVHAGDPFYVWSHRSNGLPFTDAIKALGYDGMKFGEGQIAVVADHLPAELHKDLRTHASKTEGSVKAGKGVEELKPVVEAELERLKQYPIIAKLLAKKNIPIEIQDTMGGAGAIKTGPNQYEAGVAGLYVPERLGPRERIYLSDQPVQGEFGTEYQTGVPYSQVVDIQSTLRHELAHPLYERLNDEWLHNIPAPKAELVLNKIDQLSKEWQPSEYAKESPNEWLSETFAKFTHPEYSKFKDIPPKIEEFMTRVVKAAKLKNVDLTGLGLGLTVMGTSLIANLLFGSEEDTQKLMAAAGLVGFGAKMPGEIKGVKLPRPSRFGLQTPEYGKGAHRSSIHAGPHVFNEFDTYSNIGKGQGAAAFGEGLYSATDPSVQNSYFNEFFNRAPLLIGGEATPLSGVKAIIPKKYIEKFNNITVGQAIDALTNEGAVFAEKDHHPFKREMMKGDGTSRNIVVAGMSSAGESHPYYVIRDGGFAQPVMTSKRNFQIGTGSYAKALDRTLEINGITEPNTGEQASIRKVILEQNRKGHSDPRSLMESAHIIDDVVEEYLNQLPKSEYYVEPGNLTAIAKRVPGSDMWKIVPFETKHLSKGVDALGSPMTLSSRQKLANWYSSPEEAMQVWNDLPRKRNYPVPESKGVPKQNIAVAEKLKKYSEDALIERKTPQYRLRHAPEHTYIDYTKPINEQNRYIRERLEAVLKDLGIPNETVDATGGIRAIRQLTGWEAYMRIGRAIANATEPGVSPGVSLAKDLANPEKRGRVITSRYLNSIGIGGLRFPSSGMRNVDKPNYVHFFDPEIIESNIGQPTKKLQQNSDPLFGY